MPNPHRPSSTREIVNHLFNNFEGVYGNQPRVSVSTLLLGIFLSLVFIAFTYRAHGDDLTGLASNDPKDMLSPSASSNSSSGNDLFQALPPWSHFTKMPPLPPQLKPAGAPLEVATPSPVPVTPPKEVASQTPPPAPTTVAKPEAPAAPAKPTPDLVAVSPFLQWIQSDPKAAAEARQQAGNYMAPAPADASKAPIVESPYWLPPLVDTLSAGPQPVGGSSALYQTPQR